MKTAAAGSATSISVPDATQAEALKALTSYHNDPHAVPNSATFEQIYARWSSEKFPKISASGVSGYENAFAACKALYRVKFVDLRKSHMQSVLDKCKLGYHSRSKIKTLFNQLYKYAMENDIVRARIYRRNSSPSVQIRRKAHAVPLPLRKSMRFGSVSGDVPGVDLILILIYTGWRIGELLRMQTKDVDLSEWTMRGGSKTAAGKNRLVPINTRIRPLIAARYDASKKYLIPPAGCTRQAGYSCAFYRIYVFPRFGALRDTPSCAARLPPYLCNPARQRRRKPYFYQSVFSATPPPMLPRPYIHIRISMNCAARSSFFVNRFVYCTSYCLSIVFPSTQFYPHKLYENPCKCNIYRDFRNFIYIKFSRTYYNYNPSHIPAQNPLNRIKL